MDTNNTTLIEKIYKYTIEHLPSITDNVIANIIVWIFASIISLFAFYLLWKRIENTTKEVGSQTYIPALPEYIVCNNKEKKIKNIPNILLNNRNKWNIKIKKDKKYNNEEVFFWNTRISTFIVFTDGKRILLFDRKKNKDKEAVDNPKKDVYGARTFHNSSLKYKLPAIFLDKEFDALYAIPGITIENNIENQFSLLKKIHIKKRFETVVMFGFVVYVKPEIIEYGLYEDSEHNIDIGDNILVPLECISPEEENLTAKAKIGINYLKSLYYKFEENCEEYCKSIPPLYDNINLKKDDLTKINGIGLKLQEQLYKLGIYKYEQIASWNKKHIKWINSYLYFPGRVEREKWVEQAKKLAQLK